MYLQLVLAPIAQHVDEEAYKWMISQVIQQVVKVLVLLPLRRLPRGKHRKRNLLLLDKHRIDVHPIIKYEPINKNPNLGQDRLRPLLFLLNIVTP